MSVEILGLKEFMSRLDILARNISTRVIPIIRESARRIVIDARVMVPIDTGALHDSIRANNIPDGAEVKAGGGGVINYKTGKEVDYAWYVEHGTSHQIAQPYFFPAAYNEVPKMRKRIMDNAIRRKY